MTSDISNVTSVALTVNSTPVEVTTQPRRTLADMLREDLHLTGVHLGCEHGVCGQCTVLVDGKTARSCLLFACQMQGAEVTTVEALGRPDQLHPLQQAFHENHALQCGFCTPAFLLSAYELLRDSPTLADVDLAAELSGVLCRCTGYTGILTAIRQVARDHPEGLPAPEKGTAGPLAHYARSVGERSASAPPAEHDGPRRDTVLAEPTGEPSATVDVTTELSANVDDVWALVTDIPRVANCLPGASLDEADGQDTYSGRVRLAVGPLRLGFAGQARVLEQDDAGHRLRVLAAGSERGGSSARAVITLTVAGADGDGAGTQLHAVARLFLSGRLAQFGRSLAGDISRGLFTQFGANVDATLRGDSAPAQSAGGALGAGSLARVLLKNWFARVRRLGKLRGRRRSR